MSTLTTRGHTGTVEFDGGRQTTDAVSDENSMVFTKKQTGDLQAIRDAIEAAIVAAHAPAAPAPTSQGMDLTMQLEKLAQLRDAGVLTAEEFDSKKAELLARM